MAELPITGGCGCGAVRFEVDRPLGTAGYCHCTRCQRRTGTAASAQAVLEPGSLRIVQGAEHVREWKPEDGFGKQFCALCGSALFSRRPDGEEPTTVRLGVIDGDPGVRPSFRQFVDYAVAWERIPDDGLPRHGARRPPEGR